MNFLWVRHSLRFEAFDAMTPEKQKLYMASAELEMETEEKMRKEAQRG